ncbi:MAG: hypothetical protein P4L64_16375 [Caulobacteraceae bacterium]|nr:hypothetical protein [Caulobacteraceae bacterium]
MFALALAAAFLGGCQSAKPLGARQACSRSAHYQRPKDAADAERIAKRLIIDVYGAPAVLRQEPFTTTRDADRWVVRGSPKPPETAPFLIMIDGVSGCPVYVGRDL